MLSLFRSLARHDRGATTIDYSLISAIIAVAGISAMRAVGSKMTNAMSAIASTI